MKKTLTVVLVSCLGILCAASLWAGSADKSPEVVKLESLSYKYQPVTFDHAKHAMLAGNCGTCHHEHGNNGKLPCKECHSLAPAAFKNSVTRNFQSCKSCHSTYNPEMPQLPGLKAAYHSACFQCHRGMGNVGIDPKGCTEICHALKEQKVSMKIVQ